MSHMQALASGRTQEKKATAMNDDEKYQAVCDWVGAKIHEAGAHPDDFDYDTVAMLDWLWEQRAYKTLPESLICSRHNGALVIVHADDGAPCSEYSLAELVLQSQRMYTQSEVMGIAQAAASEMWRGSKKQMLVNFLENVFNRLQGKAKVK